MTSLDGTAPPRWVRARLADIAEVRLGRQRSPEKAVGTNPVPYLRAANVTWTGLALDDVKEMDFTSQEQQVYGLRRGDILLNEASGSASEVGKPAIWQEQIPGVCFQNTLLRVRAAAELVPFLYWAFLRDARSGTFAAASKGVGIHHLSAGVLSDWQVSIPPLGEQRRIVAALDSYFSRLDAATTALKRAQANLKRYRASVLKAAVEGRLVPTEAAIARAEGRAYEPAAILLQRVLAERRRRWEEAELARLIAKGTPPKDDRWKAKYEEAAGPDTTGLPELPEGWCWASTDQLLQFVTSGSRGWARYYSESGALFLRMGNLDHDSITLDMRDIQRVSPPEGAEGERTRVEGGDILVSITADVGMVALVPDSLPEAYINQHVALCRPVPTLSAVYLAWYLSAEEGGQRLRGLQRGATKIGLGLADIRAIPVPLPPRVEQNRIAQRVEELLSVADQTHRTAETSSARSSALRQTILSWAFQGRLVDQDPADEPASVLLDRIRAERPVRATRPVAARRGRRKARTA